MSKMGMIKAYQRSPRYQQGDLFSFVKGIFGKGKALLKKGGNIVSGITEAVEDFTGGSSPAFPNEKNGGGGGGGGRRRGRGITARELRGYRKVSNLLHKEGMVSRRARGRK